MITILSLASILTFSSIEEKLVYDFLKCPKVGTVTTLYLNKEKNAIAAYGVQFECAAYKSLTVVTKPEYLKVEKPEEVKQ